MGTRRLAWEAFLREGVPKPLPFLSIIGLQRAHIDSGQLKAILRPWAAAIGVDATLNIFAVSWSLGS
jgi:hypothetical protein